ncbi:FAD-dependent monooxygenase [Virgibacillus salexigens]|uniref:2-polyprenyl-6-methoxyphenol hydroxylase n=1 Tax=Virgibacillus kapii TaxID=1638645 RepID=A0ABQ2DSY5_9BACI|nr:FAD-dependent monooxygenase [Virgibacillus kapii]GGJ71414.1 2-polyprenyl-6-methoxyphenol hydroxylase [Virgibacillus kapii]
MGSDVLIVGAGPTGLALALSMAKQGVSTKIIDKAAGPGTASRAMAVMPRTLEFYDQFGFADEMVTESIKIENINLYVDGKKRARMHVGSLGEGISNYTSPFSFPQDEHEKLLLKKLSSFGVTVEWNTELISFQERQNNVTATLQSYDETVEEVFLYVCGCDGAGSAVRQEIQADFPGGTYEEKFYVMDIKATGKPVGSHNLSLCLRDNSFVVLLPVRSTGTTRAIGVFPPQMSMQSDAGDNEQLVSFIEKAYQLQVSDVNWFSSYNVHHRVASHFRKGRAFLVGDAAHIHSPAGGQGMNTGIGDAMNLGWKLAGVIQGKSNLKLLDTFEQERKTFAERLVNTTDQAFTRVVSKRLLDRVLRKQLAPVAIPFINRSNRIRQGLFRVISQTQISYPNSSISKGEVGDIQAGDRLPYTKENYKSLQMVDWQVHIYGSATSKMQHFCYENGIKLYTFSFDSIAEGKGLQKEAIYLIRPDGHIGFTNSHQDINKLKAYLDHWGIIPFRKTKSNS